MRRNSDPWFRFYVRTLNNPKVQQLAASDFKGWVNLLCLAKEYDGALPPVEDIAFRLRLSKRKAETLIKSLEFNGLIDGDRMHDWDEMQYHSDSSTERVKRYRERQRNVPTNVPTVPFNVSETAQRQRRTETETEAETEAETETEVPATKTKSVLRAASASPTVLHLLPGVTGFLEPKAPSRSLLRLPGHVAGGEGVALRRGWLRVARDPICPRFDRGGVQGSPRPSSLL